MRTLISHYEEQALSRRQKIEDKAKSVIFSITVSASLILGFLRIINEIYESLNNKYYFILLIFFLIVGLIYFLIASIMSLNALNITQNYGFYLPDYIQEEKISDDNLKISLTPIIILSEEDIQQRYLFYKINEKNNLIKSNYVYASYISIRNGIISLSLFFIITIVFLSFEQYITNVLKFIFSRLF